MEKKAVEFNNLPTFVVYQNVNEQDFILFEWLPWKFDADSVKHQSWVFVGAEFLGNQRFGD